MSTAEALIYLKSKAAAFANVEDRIIQLQRAANTFQVGARDRGDAEGVALAQQSQKRLGAIYKKYGELKGKWVDLVDSIPGLGWVWAAPVVALAAGVIWVLARVEGEDRIIRMLEAGSLTAAEAQEILAETEGGLGIEGAAKSLVTFAGFALVGYLGWKMFENAQT